MTGHRTLHHQLQDALITTNAPELCAWKLDMQIIINS